MKQNRRKNVSLALRLGKKNDADPVSSMGNLPIRVNIMDWARILESFHCEIERTHVVVQEGGK